VNGDQGPSGGVRSLLYSAIALQGVLLVTYVVLEARLAGDASTSQGGIPVVVAQAISMGVFPALGAVILRRRPTNRVGWIFCLLNIGLVANVTVRAYVHLGVAQPGSVPAPETVVWFYTWPGFVSFGLLVLLFLLFPDGRYLSPGWRAVGRGALVAMGLAGVLAALAPGPVDPSLGLEITNPLGIAHPLIGRFVYEVSTMGYPMGILLILAAIVSTVQRYRGSGGVERLQLQWFAFGAAAWGLLVAAFLPVALTSTDWDFPLWARAVEVTAQVGAGIFPLAAGMAILRYRLYDIDRIVSRTVSYAALSLILVAVYGTAVVGLGSVVRAATGGGGGDLVVAASTLLVAAAFGPLRRRVQSGVDRRFNRARYDALRTAERFTQRLRDEVDIEVLTTEVRDVALRTLQPVHASVWVSGEGHGS
jgi:energy-converting hydrogenase Eha subunit C